MKREYIQQTKRSAFFVRTLVLGAGAILVIGGGNWGPVAHAQDNAPSLESESNDGSTPSTQEDSSAVSTEAVPSAQGESDGQTRPMPMQEHRHKHKMSGDGALSCPLAEGQALPGGECPAVRGRLGKGARPAGRAMASQGEDSFAIRGQIEAGVLYPQFHIVQFGRGTTRFDYVNDGGQDNLFTFLRFQLTAELPNQDRVRFIFQPLELETQTVLDREINIDGVVFPAGTPLDLRYSFPFYRGSYFFDVYRNESFEFYAGAGLQIRNARVDFASGNGDIFVSNRDIGPVPLLSVLGEWALDSTQRVGFEAEGLAAPGAYINGNDNDVEGLILDASVNYGWELPDFGKTFVNVRYLGGGAKGQSDSSTPPGDGFNNNFLQFWTLSLGIASPL